MNKKTHPRLFKVLQVLVSIQCFVCTSIPQIEAAETVESLIQKLTSPQRLQRTNAEQLLLEQGEKSLLIIQEVLTRRPELSFRLNELIEKIELAIANKKLAGTQVSLDSQQHPTLRQLVQSLASQTGFQVRVAPQVENLPVTLQLKNVPYWDAIDQIGMNADIGWQVQGDGLIYQPDAPLRNEAVAYPKSLRVAAVHVRQKQNLRRRTREGLIRINFRVELEPHITPYFLRIRDRQFRLLTKTSTENLLIPPFNPEAVREVPVSGQPGFEFTVDFQASAPDKALVMNLQGEVELLCAAQTQLETFSLNEQLVPGEYVEVLKFAEVKDELRVFAKIVLPEKLASFDSHRITLLHRNAWLFTNSQKRILPKSKTILQSRGQTHIVEFRFPTTETPLTDLQFVYAYPKFVRLLPARFKIDNVRHADP